VPAAEGEAAAVWPAGRVGVACPDGVAVAVAPLAEVEVASGRAMSVVLFDSGGFTSRNTATAVAAINATTEPRYTPAAGAADSGAMQRRQTSSPCSAQ
jgi:hypothetical protein